MKHLNAGCYIESVKQILTKNKFAKISPVLSELSGFKINSTYEFSGKTPQNPISILISNLISRSVITPASCFIEDIFSDFFSLTKKNIENSKISYKQKNNDSEEEIFRAFFYNFSDNKIYNENSEFKNLILKNEIPKTIGEYILPVLLQKISYNQLYDEFLKKSDTENRKSVFTDKIFLQKEIDFVIKFPYNIRGKNGIIIETDADPDTSSTDYIGLNDKKNLAELIGYEFIYIKNGQTEEGLQTLLDGTFNEYFDVLKKNFEQPLHKTKAGQTALQICLSPFEIIRISKVLNDCILNGILDLKADKWKIAVFERDIPGAFIALEELKNLYKHYSIITDTKNELPKIELEIYYSELFADTKIHKTFQGKKAPISEFSSKINYDLIIDSSVLNHDFSVELPLNKAKNSVTIRSGKFSKEQNSIINSAPILYPDFNDTNKFDQYQISDIRNSLDYLFSNYFKFEKLRDNQFTALCKALQMKNFAYFDNPGSGKTQVFEFYSILQACTNIILQIGKSQIKRQVKKIQDIGFDTCRYLMSEETDIIYNIQTLKKLSEGQINLLFANAEKFEETGFIKELENIKDKIFFTYIFIDNSERASEFSNNFNTNTENAFKHISKIFSKINLAKAALGSFISFDTRTNISDLFEIKADNFISMSSGELNSDFKTIVSYQGSKSVKDTEKVLEKSFSNKYSALNTLLKELYADKNENCTIIYSVNKHLNELARNINKDHDNLSVTIFTEKSNADENEIYEQNYFDFISANKNIMLTDKPDLFGLHEKNINNLIFFSLPDSTETIYRTLNFGDEPKTQVYFLFDNSAIEVFDFIDYPKIGGEVETIEETSELIPDLISSRHIIKNIYPGRKKELEIINELLVKIEQNQVSAKHTIERQTEKYLSGKISLEIQSTENEQFITVNSDAGTFGYIDFKTGEINTRNSGFEQKKSQKILNFVKDKADKMIWIYKLGLSDFENTMFPASLPGIESILENLNINAKTEIEFSTENNVFTEILSILSQYISKDFNEDILQDAFDNNFIHTGFIEHLNKTKRVNYVSLSIDVPEKLEELFYKYRNAKHTESALYKLRKLGIIEEYSFNPERESVSLSIKRKSPEQYKNSLFGNIEKYISPEQVKLLKDNFEEYTGKTTARKCINFYINYFYDYIVEKIYDSNQEVVSFVKAVYELENHPIIRKRNIAEYFRTKQISLYLNPLFSPSLLIDTENLKNANFDLVREYIRLSGELTDKLEHLKSSTEEILKISEGNYSVLLLNSYTIFCTYQNNQDIFEIAYTRMSKAFEMMQEKENIDYKEVVKRKNLFLDALYMRNSLLKEEINPIIQLKEITEWITEFNKKLVGSN